jgi:type II secretory pathway component HofQ
MGRPLVGNRAMSSAERQRRYIAKLKAANTQIRAQDQRIAEIDEYIDQQEQKIAELLSENSWLRGLSIPKAKIPVMPRKN